MNGSLNTTRTRVSDMMSTVTVPYELLNYGWRNGTTYLDSTSVIPLGTISGYRRTISDVSHPNFEKRRRKGEVIMGDLLLVVEEMDPGELHETFTAGPKSNWGAVTVQGPISAMIRSRADASLPEFGISSMIEQAKDVAYTKALGKASKADVCSGEILNDLGKTVSMLKKPFSGATTLLGKMVKYKKKHLGKTAASAAKATANAWLEYRYGWRPLLMDCDTIIQKAATVRQETMRKRLVCRASEALSRTQSDSYVTNAPGIPEASGVVLRTSNCRVSAGVMVEVDPQTTSDQWLAALGLRPRDVPATAWEVIPFSFVIDWFVNVGDWIEAATPLPKGLRIVGEWVTSVETIESKYLGGQLKYTVTLPAPATTFTGSFGGCSSKRTTVWRTTHPVMTSHPVLKAKMLSVPQSIDATSLMCQKLIGALKKF